MSKVAVGVVSGVLAVGMTVYFLVGEKAPNPIPAVAASGHPAQKAEAVQGSHISPNPLPSPPPPVAPTSENAPDDTALPMNMPEGSDFEKLFKNPKSVAVAHAVLEKEERDPVWAAETEGAFNRAFSENADLRSYTWPKVECRTTQCEVRLLAHHAPQGISPQKWGGMLTKGVFPNLAAASPTGALPFLDEIMALANDIDGGSVAVVHIKFKRD